MQTNARPECLQLFGADPARVVDEVGLFDGEYMVEVEINIGKKLKGQKNGKV